MGYDGFIYEIIWLRLKSAGCAQIPSWAGLQVKGIYVVNCMKPAIRNIGWRSSSYGSGASAAVGNLNQANITQVKWRGDKFCSKLWSANMTEMRGKRIKTRHQGWVEKNTEVLNLDRNWTITEELHMYSIVFRWCRWRPQTHFSSDYNMNQRKTVADQTPAWVHSFDAW